jgi:hypothetical protein
MQIHSGYQRACTSPRCTSRDERKHIIAKEGITDTPLPEYDIIAHKIFNLNVSGRQDWFPSLAICHGSRTALHDTKSKSLSFDLRRIFQKFMFHISARQLQAVLGNGKWLLGQGSNCSMLAARSVTRFRDHLLSIVHTVLFCRLLNVKQSRTS